jgi:hypothetical protein
MKEEEIKLLVKEVFISIGIDTDDKIKTQQCMATIREVAALFEDKEYQQDMIYLRKWRKSIDLVSNVSIKTAIGIVVTGFFGMLIFTFKSWFLK